MPTIENLSMLLTFLILGTTVALFIFSRLRSDLVALLSLLALFVVGILSTSEALAGFSDSITVMVAALFVVGEGLSRTGITAWLGNRLIPESGSSETRLLVVAMIGTAVLSGILSNTGTVAVLLPAVAAAAWRLNLLPSRLLMPIAIAANLGGLLTLIGSPPNIVVSDTLTAANFEPFTFFEFAWLGIPLVVTAVLYVTTVGRRLLRDRPSGERPADLASSMAQYAAGYKLSSRLHQLRILPGSPLIGKTLSEAALGHDYELSALHIDHEVSASTQAPDDPRDHSSRRLRRLEQFSGRPDRVPGPNVALAANDLLLAVGTLQDPAILADALGVEVTVVDANRAPIAQQLISQEIGIAEVLVAPRSEHQGRTIAEAQIAERFSVQVLALRRGNRLLRRKGSALEVGDSLLVRGPWSAIEQMGRLGRGFVVVGDPDALARQVVALTPRSILAVLILAGMVGLMFLGVVPTVFAVLLAAIAMVLIGCVSMDGAYRSINWQTVVIIAAMLPMSTALQITGGAQLVADTLVNSLGAQGPLLLMAGVFLLTTAFSQVMSNTATTVLVAPIVLDAATTLGVAPQPMMMMVAAGAAAAFLTPIASPTNTLVFVPGGYTWGDYMRIGLPLLLLTLLVSLLVVPLVWPL